MISTAADISTAAEPRPKFGDRLQEVVETGLIAAGITLLFWLPHTARQDGWIRFEALSELLGRGRIPDTTYSLVGPLFSAPLWFLGNLSGIPWWWTTRFNVLVLAAGVLCIHVLFKDRLPNAIVRRFCLLLVAASMFSNHVLFYYSEVFTSVLVAVGCVLIVTGPRPAGWIAIVTGVINAPATVVGLITLTCKHILASHRLRYALAVVVAGGLIMLETWIRRGSPIDSEYAGGHGPHTVMPYSGLPGFSTPIFFGLFSLLFSFGKGLVFFAPGLLLPVRRIVRELKQQTGTDIHAIFGLWISYLAGLLVVYSVYWSWHGGWFWGPRYLLIASIPASFALAACLSRVDLSLPLNLLTLGVLSLSMWVGINGAVYGDDTVRSLCLQRFGNFEEPLCYYTPEFSVLWFPFVAHTPPEPSKVSFLVYGVLVAVVLIVPVLVRVVRQVATGLNRSAWRISKFRF